MLDGLLDGGHSGDPPAGAAAWRAWASSQASAQRSQSASVRRPAAADAHGRRGPDRRGPWPRRTRLALTLPDEQADAGADHHAGQIQGHHLQLGRRSRASAKHRVCGRRGAPAPSTTAPAPSAARPSASRQAAWPASAAGRAGGARRRRRSRRCRGRSRCRRAGRAPGRRRAAGASGVARGPTTSAPTPCGPPSLWAESARVSAPSAVDVDGDLAGRLDGVDVQPAAGGAHQRGGLGHRLDDAGLVVGQHQADEGRAGAGAPGARASQSEVGHAVGVHRPDLDRRAPDGGGGLAHASCSVAPTIRRCDAGGDGAVDGQGVGLGAAADEGDRGRRGAPTRAATSARAVSTRARAARPAAWTEEGLPPLGQRARHRLAPRGAPGRWRCSRDRRARLMPPAPAVGSQAAGEDVGQATPRPDSRGCGGRSRPTGRGSGSARRPSCSRLPRPAQRVARSGSSTASTTSATDSAAAGLASR